MTTSGPLQGIRILDLSIAADRAVRVRAARRPGRRGDQGRAPGHRRHRAVDRRPGRRHQRAVPGVQPRQALHRRRPRRSRRVATSCASSRADSDVVVQNWRPGVAEQARRRLRRPPRATTSSTCRSRASATKGPYARKGAYDTVIQAYGGVGWSQADPATATPAFVRQVLADKVTALTASPGDHRGAARARARPRRAARAPVDARRGRVVPVGRRRRQRAPARRRRLAARRASPAGARPFRFTDGWGVATPTANADFFGMCRAFGVDGWDDPRLAHRRCAQQNIDVSRGRSPSAATRRPRDA